MEGADFTRAAALLEAAGANTIAEHEAGKAAAFLKFLGLLAQDGSARLTPVKRRQFVRLLHTASRLDSVFPMRVPAAPGAAFFGAARTHGGGGESVYAGVGQPKRSDYAGFGANLAEAFCACIGEAAEHDAMFLRRRDARVSAEGGLPLFDARMKAAGRIDAALILREAGDSAAAPRTSTGYAAGPTVADAALTALLECVERHAVSLWFNGLRRPGELPANRESKAYCASLRGPDSPQVRLMRLAHEIKGVEAAAAWSISEAGRIAVGYGCARSAGHAAMKAVRELCQGEFALFLEAQSAAAGQGVFTARAEMFGNRPELFVTVPARGKANPGAKNLAVLCAGFPHHVRFVNLTLPGDCVPVVCALVDGLRDIAGEFGDGRDGPL